MSPLRLQHRCCIGFVTATSAARPALSFISLTHGDPFTVLTPIHNGERYIREAIEGILNQTYSVFELLAIDDGSIDRTSEIVTCYVEGDGRGRLIQRDRMDQPRAEPRAGVSQLRLGRDQ